MAVRLFAALLFVLITAHTNLLALDYDCDYYCIQRNSILGKGASGNEFEGGYGLRLEAGVMDTTGVGIILYGTSVNWADNRAFRNSAKVRFFEPYYFEYRNYYKKKTCHLFWGCGFGWIRMHVEGSEGADNQYRLSLGYGALFGNKVGFLPQVIVRPYLLFGNSLGQRWGVEFLFGIGYVSKILPK